MTQGDEVEDLARELGWWLDGVWAADRPGWALHRVDAEFMLTYWAAPGQPREPGVTLTSTEALLLLHLARIGPTRERCPACEGSNVVRVEVESELRPLHGEWSDYPEGATVAVTQLVLANGSPAIWKEPRPCPACTGPAVKCEVCEDSLICSACAGLGKVPGKPTGWLTREQGWAERWLRARPQECKACLGRVTVGHYDESHEPVLCGACEDGTEPGDPEARADLWVLADQLQDKPDPLGDVLALWLSGAPCSLCKGRGAIYLAYDTTPTCDCRLCGGAGKAYAAQLIEASP